MWGAAKHLVPGLVVMLGVCPTAASRPQDASDSTETGRHALLVGCSEYPNLEQALPDRYEAEILLRGPENDVELVQRALREVLGFTDGDMTVLAGWPDRVEARPTKANIVHHLKRIAREAGDGDRVIVFMAGHGSRQRAMRRNDPEEPDGLDEVFLPADVRPAARELGRIPNALRDDEIGAYVRSIRDQGASVWLLLDACHSGTMVRGASGFTMRGVDPSMLGVTSGLRGTRGGRFRESSGLGRESLDGVAAMYGAQSYGKAPEMDLPRTGEGARCHGLFTYLLAQELVRTRGRTTYRELGERVVAAYQALPCRITVPLCEGDLQRRILTGKRSDSFQLLATRTEESLLRLNLGLLGGVDEGTVVEVFAEPERSDDPLGRLAVTRAGLYGADCELVEGALPDEWSALPARIVERPLGSYRLRLAIVDAERNPLSLESLPETVRERLGLYADRFPLTDDPEVADWLLSLEDGSMWLEPAEWVRPGERWPVSERNLVERLGAILKVRNLKRVTGSSQLVDDIGEDLDLWIEHQPAGARQATRARTGDLVHPGDRIRIRMQKRSAEAYDVTVLYLDANHGVTALHPRRGRTARLEAGAQGEIEVTGWWNVVDDSLGLEHILVLARRAGGDEVLDLSWLEQSGGALRGESSRDPFERLLYDLAAGEGLRSGRRIPSGEERAQARLLTLQIEWPTLGPPPWPRGEPRSVPAVEVESPGSRRDSPSEPPEAWALEGRFAFARSPKSRTRYDLLLVGEDEPRRVFVDLDGGVQMSVDAEQVVRDRSFDAEAVFDFSSDGWTAWYDRDDSGRFDLVVIDRDLDAVAEEGWEWTGDGWSHRADIALPWLSQGHLRFVRSNEDKKLATARFRCLVREE